MSLILYHPMTQPGKANSLSQDIKDRLFMASIEIIEYSHLLESETSTKKWGWLFHTYIQWHAIAYILGELCMRDNSAIVDRAWKALDIVFEEWGRAVTHTKSGMLWQPMRKLMAKARRKRQENMQQAVTDELGIPSKYMRPPASAFAKPSPCPGNIARDRLLPQNTDLNPTLEDPSTTQLEEPTPMLTDDQAMMVPIIGMGLVMPDQMQQPQEQDRQPMTWPIDNSALVDMDMNTLDSEVNWEGWDDMVRDFQMEQVNQPDMARGPTLGGMGQWW